ncbi:MAG: phenylacetate-CoA oxygenase/reductase subunit PaaK [Rhodospirillaceae bacterium]|nr:phenylacetate-CoA oxygenase/reductase subunit PaaK [Rhodospirillaceae bacterium]
MPRFHTLTVNEVRRETPDCVSIAFDVPNALAEDFGFSQGQYLTLKSSVDGEEVRRSYSICSGVGDGELRVAVKRVEDGRFSSYANDDLAPGDTVEVMTPDGRFTTELDPSARRTYVAFAAGSGITPILSIAKSVLAVEPESRFTLFYGNRTLADIIFRGELDDLKDRYPDRVSILHVLSREPQETELLNGRLNADKCRIFLRSLVNPHAVDHFFLCGPKTMTDEIQDVLGDHGIARDRIHFELFANPDQIIDPSMPKREPKTLAEGQGHEISIVLDGLTTEFKLTTDEPILDAALLHRADLPYGCKGGMCCTCRAKLVEGEVEMDVNYALAPEEIERGFVLSCQSRAKSKRVVLDFDQR